MRELFRRQPKFNAEGYDPALPATEMPDDLFFKCPRCKELNYGKEFEEALKVCLKCGYHARLSARERLDVHLDPHSFTEWDAGLTTVDPLGFQAADEGYPAKVAASRRKTGLTEAVVSGCGAIEGRPLAVVAGDFRFLGASMGSVYGEKIVRAVERAREEGWPVLTISTSGGARMQEGIFSLMQMAKTTGALTRLARARLPHISLLVDPCYGGVTASYATSADVVIAEPGALIGFAGPKIVEQITRQKLPEGFQTAEFLLEHGMLDQVVPRREIRAMLSTLLYLYGGHYRDTPRLWPAPGRTAVGAEARLG